jgi:hypothetical protein
MYHILPVPPQIQQIPDPWQVGQVRVPSPWHAGHVSFHADVVGKANTETMRLMTKTATTNKKTLYGLDLFSMFTYISLVFLSKKSSDTSNPIAIRIKPYLRIACVRPFQTDRSIQRSIDSIIVVRRRSWFFEIPVLHQGFELFVCRF